MSQTVTIECQHDAVVRSRRMFHRVLSSWTMDLLSLRTRGLDVPGPRSGLAQHNDIGATAQAAAQHDAAQGRRAA